MAKPWEVDDELWARTEALPVSSSRITTSGSARMMRASAICWALASAPVWRVRLLALGIATLLAWGVAQFAGVDLAGTQPGQDEVPIGAGNVAASVVIFGGAGWAVRALLDRFAKRRAVLIWRIGAGVVFVLDALPVIFADVTVGTEVVLAILHVI